MIRYTKNLQKKREMKNKLTTKQRLAKADKEMMGIVRKYLNRHGITVRKWLPYNDRRSSFRNVVYEAYFDAHQVSIPIPIDRYSFYVCMHEIGHLVRGDRRYGYVMEYVAERWALDRCQKYGYFTKQTERFAKQYVYRALLEDVVFRVHPIDKIRQDILDWIGCTAEQVRRDSIKLGKIMLTKRVPRPEVLVFNEKDIVDAPSAYKALIGISLEQLNLKGL